MGEETEIFKLEIDIVSSDDSRRRARQRDERHGGRQGSSGARGGRGAAIGGAGAAVAAGGIRGAVIVPSIIPAAGGPVPAKPIKPTPSQQKASLKKRLKAIRGKAPRLDRNFFTSVATSTMRAAPVIGGALALGFFQVMNAERLAALDEITGNIGTLGAAIAVAREVKPRFEAAAKTISQAVDIGNAFGALGSTPPAAAFGELIPLLFKVNKAQALQQFDLKEAMFRSAGSAVNKTIEGVQRVAVDRLVDILRGGMRG